MAERRAADAAARFGADLLAGLTLAAYAIPVSLAYATLAGLPPQVGIYGYLLGGLGYAVAGSSRYLAVGPTSAISLMIAGTVGDMAGGDVALYGQIAVAAALGVAAMCLLAWLFRLSVLVKLVSDSVLTGFKAGAGLSIALTQLPSFFGVPGGGHTLLGRVWLLAQQIGGASAVTVAVGSVAVGMLWVGHRWRPAWPISLLVVALSIVAVHLLGLTAHGVAVTGVVPSGLPDLGLPVLRPRDQEGVVALSLGCMLLAYIEGVAAARTFAIKYGEAVDPRRELLGLAAANLATGLGGGYPVAGGLSQSAVNERAGARSRWSLVVASAALAVCLLHFTWMVADLPRAVLAAVVLMAVGGLIDIRALATMWRLSRMDFLNAVAALVGVLVLGILQGLLLAALVSILLVLMQASAPHVAFVGRIPGTDRYSDMERHPDNLPIPGAVVFRPEASLRYLNVEHVLDSVMARVDAARTPVRAVFCDLSASPMMDLAGAQMLGDLQAQLHARGITLTVADAHGRVRDLLRACGLDSRILGVARGVTLEAELAAFVRAG
ncbi:MAG: SulP family inorganic anion transporter [Acetobacteraceae bacterium]